MLVIDFLHFWAMFILAALFTRLLMTVVFSPDSAVGRALAYIH